MKSENTKTKYIVNLCVGIISIVIAVLIFMNIMKMNEPLNYIVGGLLAILGLYYGYTSIKGLLINKDKKEE